MSLRTISEPPPMPMSGHKTIRVKCGDMAAHIDEGIADLILDCWRLGLKTHNSCERNLYDMVWIEFELESTIRFLNMVCRHSIELARHVQKACSSEERWDYDALTFNKAIKHDVVWPPDIMMTISVRFPVNHLPKVKKIIREFAENKYEERCPVTVQGISDIPIREKEGLGHAIADELVHSKDEILDKVRSG